MKQPIKTAVILAGGEGSRLRPLTYDIPKPMVNLLGKPILQWIIQWLRNNGILNIVIGLAYKKKTVIDYFGDGSEFGVKIKYSVHSVEGETGEGFRLAIERHVNDDLFLAMNGDEITNFNTEDLVSYHRKWNPIATVTVANPRCPFGTVKTDENGRILCFEEKPVIPSLLVSVGVYLFNHSIMDFLPEKGAIEKVTFPLLAEKKLLRAYHMNGTWLTVNTMKDVKYAESVLREEVREGRWPK